MLILCLAAGFAFGGGSGEAKPAASGAAADSLCAGRIEYDF